MPCYNQGLYIEDAVQSVLDQSYSDIQLIIVDDCSTDGLTREKIQKFGKNFDSRITVISLEKNSGVSVARNIGAGVSGGEYLLFLDADDMIHTDFINKSLKVLRDNLDCSFVTSDVAYFGKINRKHSVEEFDYYKLLARNFLPVTGLLYRVDFFKTSGFASEMTYGLEDWEFWIRFFSNGKKAIILREYLFRYRIKKNSKNVDALQNVKRARSFIVSNNSKIFADAIFIDPVETFEYRLISQSNDYNLGYRICTVLRKIKIFFGG